MLVNAFRYDASFHCSINCRANMSKDVWEDGTHRHCHIHIRSNGPFYCYHNFSWLCVWGGYGIIRFQLFHIDLEKACFFTTVSYMIYSNIWVHTGLKIVFLCSVPYVIVIIMQTYLTYLTYMFVRYILSSVCLNVSPCLNNHSCNIGVCVFSSLPFLFWWLCEYLCCILSSPSNRKYEKLVIIYA